MSRYRKVLSRMYEDDKFPFLTEDGQRLWVYHLTGPRSTPFLLYSEGPGSMSDTLRARGKPFPPARLKAARRELAEKGMVWYADDGSHLVFCPNGLRQPENWPTSPNEVITWTRLFAELPRTPFRDKCLAHWRTLAPEIRPQRTPGGGSPRLSHRMARRFLRAIGLDIPERHPDDTDEASEEGNGEGTPEANDKGNGKPKRKANGKASRIQEPEQEQEQEPEQEPSPSSGSASHSPPPPPSRQETREGGTGSGGADGPPPGVPPGRWARLLGECAALGVEPRAEYLEVDLVVRSDLIGRKERGDGSVTPEHVRAMFLQNLAKQGRDREAVAKAAREHHEA